MHIITTHKNTDFDGLASVIAGTLLFPGSVGVIPKSVNANVAKFLSTHKTAFNIVLPKEVNLDEVDTLTVVDTDQWRRIDRLNSLQGRQELKINIWDHHQNGGDIKADFICQEPVGATVTLLIREMKKKGMELNPLISTILLIGLYEDTGHLSFPATRPEDAMAAAFLLENGADLNVAATFLNPPYEEIQKDVLFTMMQDTEKVNHNNYTVGINILRLEKKVPMLAAVVTMYRKIINADAVFVILVNDEASSTVIARSGVDRIDVGALLRQLGGGGHPAAASVTVKTKDYGPEEIKEKIIELVRKNRQSGAVVADLMSFPVTFVSPDQKMNEVREIMQQESIRGVLVGTETDLQGIIVIWDFKKLKLDKQWNQPVKAFMVRDVSVTKPDMLASEAAQFMVKKNIGHLPVSHEGKIIGIVTRTDILNYFYGMLPE
ncbi:MAG: CBS domain-containing protein [Desulfobulbaceae bacterium]|nr:MAG: CBS domain-containing protein [Desulfobulbaceae bacterium]